MLIEGLKGVFCLLFCNGFRFVTGFILWVFDDVSL